LEGLVAGAVRFKTIEMFPGFAIRLASITTVTCVEEIVAGVMLAPPFHTSETPGSIAVPLIVSVKGGPPAVTLEGEIEVKVPDESMVL
jgi:hypothetical protein